MAGSSKQPKPVQITQERRSKFQQFVDSLNIRLSHTDLMMFTKYLSVLLKSGLPINDALGIIADQSKGALKIISTTLKVGIERGKTIAQGMRLYPQVFGGVYVSLVAAGESSGTLQANLTHLTNQIQKQHALRQKVRGAMMYPIIILVGAVMLAVGIVVFVLPNIVEVFSTLNVELPITTRILLWIAMAYQENGVLFFLGLILLVLLVILVPRIPFCKPPLHSLLMRLPIVGVVARNINLARITRVMGTMLISGSRLDEVLAIGETVTGNVRYRQHMQNMQVELARGNQLTAYMAEHQLYFPSIFVRMTKVGEQSGTLGDMMLYLADFYEQQVDDAMGNVSRLVEPLLLIGIGLMVAVLALSIIAPIYQVIGGV